MKNLIKIKIVFRFFVNRLWRIPQNDRKKVELFLDSSSTAFGGLLRMTGKSIVVILTRRRRGRISKKCRIVFKILRHSPFGEFLRMTEKKQNCFQILRRPPIGGTPQNDKIIFMRIEEEKISENLRNQREIMFHADSRRKNQSKSCEISARNNFNR